MTTTTELRPATAEDYEQVTALLKANNLPAEDIDSALPCFFVTEQNGRITGSIGLELYGNSALLRSMAVAAEYRNQGLAGSLVTRLLQYAAALHVQQVYLITTTASGYFARKGFSIVDRSAVPKGIGNSTEFSYLCPAAATVMVQELKS